MHIPKKSSHLLSKSWQVQNPLDTYQIYINPDKSGQNHRNILFNVVKTKIASSSPRRTSLSLVRKILEHWISSPQEVSSYYLCITRAKHRHLKDILNIPLGHDEVHNSNADIQLPTVSEWTTCRLPVYCQYLLASETIRIKVEHLEYTK